jgi:3-oxoacyl-[acyl-carrier protein] reductase
VFSLKGKTAVITGGGRGIGRGIARAMAEQGANVVITGRTLAPLEDAAAEIRRLGARALIVQGDIMRMETIDQTVAETLATFGSLDCWVNNAGGTDRGDVGPSLELTEEQWDRVVDLNMKWPFFAAQAAARAMTRGGSIINISSRMGSQPCPQWAQYGAAKAGLENLTATLAVEWGHLNIRVNGIAPGMVRTEDRADERGGGSAGTDWGPQIATIPLRRTGVVDDVGPLAVYFASDESAWISGQVVHATGGSRIPFGLVTYLDQIHRTMSAREPS